MDLTTAMDKIEKLLRLAQSANTHEAQAALLKAQQLMVEYKVSEADLAQAGTAEKILVLKIFRDEAAGDAWHHGLASLLADNFRCRHLMLAFDDGGREGHLIVLESDCRLAARVIQAALAAAALGRNAYMEKLPPALWYVSGSSWQLGFYEGLKAQFDRQRAAFSAAQALVLVVPAAVDAMLDNVGDVRMERMTTAPLHDPHAYSEGYENGSTWSTEPALGN